MWVCVGVKDVRLKYLSNVNRWGGKVVPLN